MQQLRGYHFLITNLSESRKLMNKMSPTKYLKFIMKNFDKLGLVLMVVPVLVAMTACTGEINVDSKKDLASREGTHGSSVVLMPDSRPSIGDGQVYWNKADCASCHGPGGKGVAGKCDIDLTNTEWMRGRKPNEQYKTIAFGEGLVTKMPVLSSEGKVDNMDPIVVREFTHKEYASQFDKRILWDLVFYTRSLASPLLPEKEHMAMKAVFGANCAVCHGTRGAGDGPLNKGLILQPNPANFNKFVRFYDRTDEQLWDHIAHGIKWEGMPDFLGKEDRGNKVKFDADYIWKLVQYVRNFHEMSEFELEIEEAKKLGFIKEESVDDDKAKESSPKPEPEVNETSQTAPKPDASASEQKTESQDKGGVTPEAH